MAVPSPCSLSSSVNLLQFFAEIAVDDNGML